MVDFLAPLSRNLTDWSSPKFQDW